jgi:hypothetical protein
MQDTKVGNDLGKDIFQVHGKTTDGTVVFNRSLQCGQLLTFYKKLPSFLVGIETCRSAHHWARQLRSVLKQSVKRASSENGTLVEGGQMATGNGSTIARTRQIILHRAATLVSPLIRHYQIWNVLIADRTQKAADRHRADGCRPKIG